MQIIRYASYTANAWKNGGGITHEAIRMPPSGATFRWRVSIAHIAAAGPFSEFAGHQRKMVLLRGAGVRVTFAGRVHFLQEVGDLVEFDGAVATECELVDGPCVDLNLMTAKALSAVEAWVEPVESALRFRVAASPQIGLIVAVRGALAIDVGRGAPVTLAPWDLAILDAGEEATVGTAAVATATVGTVTAMATAPAQVPTPLVFLATVDDNCLDLS